MGGDKEQSRFEKDCGRMGEKIENKKFSIWDLCCCTKSLLMQKPPKRQKERKYGENISSIF